MSRPGSAMAGAALLALLSLAGCTGDGPAPSAPAPVATEAPAPRSPDLMGGPPEAAANAPPAEDRTFTAMAPIANPEDMSADQREQLYGHRYDHPLRRAHGRSMEPYALGRHAQGGHGRRIAEIGRHKSDHRIGPQSAHRGAVASGHVVAPTISPRSAPPPVQNPADRSASIASQPPSAPPIAPVPPPIAGAGPNLDWLSIPGARLINVAGLGSLPSKYLTATGLLLFAAILLAVAAGFRPAPPRRRRPGPVSIGHGPAFVDRRPADYVSERSEAPAPFPRAD